MCVTKELIIKAEKEKYFGISSLGEIKTLLDDIPSDFGQIVFH